MEYWKLLLFGIFKIVDAISYCIKRQLKSDVIIFPNTPSLQYSLVVFNNYNKGQKSLLPLRRVVCRKVSLF